MKRDSITAYGFLAFWLFAILLIILVVQMRMDGPIIRPRLERKEPFQSGGGRWEDSPEVLRGDLAPKEADLERLRDPYTLLTGWLTPKSPEEAGRPGETYNPPGAPSELPDSSYGQTVQDLYKEVNILPRPAFTAETCYSSDFQTRLERTGNYRQITNNYKRADPDSCSAPLHDTALGFYKVAPVPYVGCLSGKEWQRDKLPSIL